MNGPSRDAPPAHRASWTLAAALAGTLLCSACANVSASARPIDAWIPPQEVLATPAAPEMTATPSAPGKAVPPEPLSEVEAPPVAQLPPAPEARPPPTLKDPALASAFSAFRIHAQKERAGAKKGSALTPGQQENWSVLLFALDEYLRRPAWHTEQDEVVAARASLERELSRDARAFGDFPGGLAEAVMARLTSMAVRLAEFKRLAGDDEGNDGPELFAWPVDPVRVTSFFGRRRHPITRRMKQHRGIDLAARKGQPVLTAGAGVVVKAGRNSSHGLQVTLQHGSGLQTRYSHLSEILVDVGMRLDEGEVLGLAGRTGRATGVHLHFEVWSDDTALDPLDYLREQPEPDGAEANQS